MNRRDDILALMPLGALHAIALAATLFVVPLDRGNGWQVLTYDGIPRHETRFSDAGLEIVVARSASPVIYRLPAPLRVQRLHVRGRIDGRLNVTADRQGQRGHDDFAMRVGLVEPGKRRLGAVARLFAREWLRQLHDLAPPGTGIAQVRFFNVGVAGSRIGTRRRHPLSDLLHEEIVATPNPDGTFEISASFDRPLTLIALWISSDGDDTGSSFVVTVERIALEVNEMVATRRAFDFARER